MLKDSIYSELPESKDSIADNYVYIGSSYYADTTDLKKLLAFVAAGNKAFIISNQPNLITDSLLTAEHRIITIEDVYESIDTYLDTDSLNTDSMETIVDIEEDDYYDEDFETDEEYLTEEYIIDEYAGEPAPATLFYYLEDTLINIHHGKNEADAYKLSKYFRHKRRPYSWTYFSDSVRTKANDSLEILANFNRDYINYIKFKYGNGEFYIHTTPLIFTNYNMLNDTAMNYCRESLSHLGEGVIYWDEENRKYNYQSPAAENPSDPNKPLEGPLEFILSESGLRKAWYVLLGGTLLYLFFGSKRKQRVVQNMDNMENTSIEYAEVLSQMFMNQKDHKKLVSMKMDMFKSFVRDRYGIRLPLTMNEENDELYNSISHKSNVDKNIVEDIFEHYKILGSIAEVETAEMLQFHNKLNKFYHNSK